jgi:hypothetical protein
MHAHGTAEIAEAYRIYQNNLGEISCIGNTPRFRSILSSHVRHIHLDVIWSLNHAEVENTPLTNFLIHSNESWHPVFPLPANDNQQNYGLLIASFFNEVTNRLIRPYPPQETLRNERNNISHESSLCQTIPQQLAKFAFFSTIYAVLRRLHPPAGLQRAGRLRNNCSSSKLLLSNNGFFTK